MRRILGCALVLILTVPLSSCGNDGGGDDDELGVQLIKVGNPLFEPVDFHKISARIGVPADDFADFSRTLESLLPPPNHQNHPAIGIGPGAAHSGPYSEEFADVLGAQGYEDKDVFDVADYTGGQGVFIVWMVVPTSQAPSGSSPDFQSGRIIPSSVFPIAVEAEHFFGAVSQFDFGFDVPALDGALSPPFTVDGHSHFPLFFATNGDGAPEGEWVWRFTMRDQAGNGWNISVPYTVEP